LQEAGGAQAAEAGADDCNAPRVAQCAAVAGSSTR
jgi:hypothetical protein